MRRTLARRIAQWITPEILREWQRIMAEEEYRRKTNIRRGAQNTGKERDK